MKPAPDPGVVQCSLAVEEIMCPHEGGKFLKAGVTFVASMHTAWNRMAERPRRRVSPGYLLPLYFFLSWEHLYCLGKLKVIFLKEV